MEQREVRYALTVPPLRFSIAALCEFDTSYDARLAVIHSVQNILRRTTKALRPTGEWINLIGTSGSYMTKYACVCVHVRVFNLRCGVSPFSSPLCSFRLSSFPLFSCLSSCPLPFTRCRLLCLSLSGKTDGAILSNGPEKTKASATINSSCRQVAEGPRGVCSPSKIQRENGYC